MTSPVAPTPPALPTLPPEKEAWKAMFALSLGFFISLLDQTMVTVALSSIQRDLGATVNQVTWVPAAFLLAVVVPLLFTGRLGDKYGQRKIFMLGLVLYGTGAVAAALAPTVGFLISARVVMGLGASLQMPQTMAIINRIFDRTRRGRALGMWGIVGSVAALTGPLLGGFMVGAFGWHAVFWIHVPLATTAFFLALKWVPALPTTARAIDYPSVAVSLVALSCVVLGIQQGSEAGWAWWIWVLLAVGAGCIGVFLKLQANAAARGTEALVPLQLFTDRNYCAGTLAIVAMGFMAASMMIPIMLWLQDIRGLTAGQAGLLVTPMAVLSMLVSPVAGILADRVDPRRLASSGFSILLVGFLIAWGIMRSDASAWWLMVPVSLLGVGQSFIWGSNAATTMRDIAPQLMGSASGVYNTSRQVGSVIGVAAVSAVIQMGGSREILATESGVILTAQSHNFANSLLVIVVMLAVGLISSLFLRDTLHK
ncbi:membrane protein [Corynebacterium phocae]|uniref:Membrane protein n=1 Tax=Corynebacterium phocae TaxID=161895 RepID=A0A1L7D3T4_9CORY|nr:MFS transporter [Corynebacterium phocae]APT92733.1 membrane protein [Corynebacterium phocae]KAA8723043.1 MFS transporter [Corynebacterium phocae]